MAFAELAWELQGRTIEERKGDKILVIDIKNLPAMSRRLKEVRDEIAALKKEEDRLKSSILAHPDCKIGYADDGIKVTENREVDMEDQNLIDLLKKKDKWDEVTNVSISKPKLRAVAEEDKEIAEAIVWLTSRKINKQRGKRRR